MRQLGTDLALSFAGTGGYYEDADLVAGLTSGRVPRTRDLVLVQGVASAEQMLVNRLKTRRGELAALGHPEYGSRHHELVGQPNVERTRNLIKLYILEALAQEPRVERVQSCRVSTPDDPPRSLVRIDIELILIDQPKPLNLVVPFSLEVAA
jgi:phage baseplate assembly protein W